MYKKILYSKKISLRCLQLHITFFKEVNLYKECINIEFSHS